MKEYLFGYSYPADLSNMNDLLEIKSKTDLQQDRGLMILWIIAGLLIVSALFSITFLKINADKNQLLISAEKETLSEAVEYMEHVRQIVGQIDQLSRVIKYQWERKADVLDLEEQYKKGIYQTMIFPVVINAEGFVAAGNRVLKKGH